MTTSYPKDKIKILLLENVHQVAVDDLRKDGFTVTTAESMPMEQLIEELKTTHAVGIRSKTPMNEAMLKHAPKLLCIGCFCIGTDRVDLAYAASRGIPVFNAPFSNTRSVGARATRARERARERAPRQRVTRPRGWARAAELVIGEIIALSRGLMDRSAECHRGAWYKVAKGCCEVRGKLLGIVGYGHVGTQLSILAENIGLKVKFYDISPKLNLGNAEFCESLDALLQEADYVSLHVPRNDSTRGMFGAKQFAQMKKGAFFINAARGEVVRRARVLLMTPRGGRGSRARSARRRAPPVSRERARGTRRPPRRSTPPRSRRCCRAATSAARPSTCSRPSLRATARPSLRRSCAAARTRSSRRTLAGPRWRRSVR